MNELLSGIYKIYCRETDKYYIGQSVDVKSRLSQHLNELRNNKHINQLLQSDFNIYGEEAFTFEKVKDVEEEFLNIFEKYYMEYYKSLSDGYNKMPMNNLIRDKYKKNLEYLKDKELIDYFNSIDYVEIPILAGDVYAYELLFRLKYFHDDIKNITSVSDEVKECIGTIGNYLNCDINDIYNKMMNTIELEIRRRFNKAGIKYIEYIDIDNLDGLLENKIFPIKIGFERNIKEIEMNIKCI